MTARATTRTKSPTAKKKTPKKKTPKKVTAKKAEANSIRVEIGEGDDALLGRKLEQLACDPIAIIAKIACDEGADLRLRFYAAKELATYLMTKPRRVGELPATAPTVDVGAIITRAWSPEGRHEARSPEGRHEARSPEGQHEAALPREGVA